MITDRRGLAVLIALVAWEFVPLDPVRAQCSSSSMPPPPPTVTYTSSNQSYGLTPPLTPFALSTATLPGCNGGNGGFNQSGGDGSPGQPGGQLNVNALTQAIIGGGPPDAGFNTYGAPMGAAGNAGGSGGQSGTVDNSSAQGGNGGSGGAGGAVTVRFDGAFIPDPNTGLATFGLSVGASGGAAGAGGDSSDQGIFAKQGGDGGAGAPGGQITLVGSGSVQAQIGAVSVTAGGGFGGAGGNAATIDQLDSTQGGNGGNGGQGGSASLQWLSGTVSSQLVGLAAAANGGDGGYGGTAGATISTQGGNAGTGGNGGVANVLLGSGGVTINLASPLYAGSGVFVSANGGGGGAGGLAGAALGAGGGNGGSGGNGGAASATILGSVTFNGVNTAGMVSGQGVLVQANGGPGGAGADINAGEGEAGGGGFAGAGGRAGLMIGNATTTGAIRTTGSFAHGALVQSVGGGGGNGGNAAFFGAGGAGAAGGDGGAVTVTSADASVVTAGTNGTAVIAQSIGGGGGSGGDSSGIAVGAALAIGGNGGLGGNGSTVNVNLGQGGVFASTNAIGGGGVLAQSIGGAGGNAGSATSTGAGSISLVIGGDAGGGGAGGSVTIDNNALITTYGDHAAGLQAQSIGGGGGKAGSAFSFVFGILPVASVAVGGLGGGGGPAGNVSVSNGSQITTYGADAQGILAQSVGGGGGTGGAAAARAIAVSPSQDIPAISVSVATGGRGGSGNTGGQVGLDNSGLITTAGDGATGVMAQSIGGGGGTGGDSTAASYAGTVKAGLAFTAAVAVGGSGGTGGTGGPVTLTNEGLVATLGQDAYGAFAQSVGGGGGTAGAGDATASSSEAAKSFAASIAVGGAGGSGGDGGTVTLGSSGAIVTRGDGAAALFAQSVGGGGGTAGGGVATAAGGSVSIAVGVGGSGGAGGNGNTASATNSGSIVTRGTSAIGMSVQSIGGGGGVAGKGGATAGGVSNLSNAQALFDTLSGGLNIGQSVTQPTDFVLQIGQAGENIKASYDEVKSIFAQPQADQPQEGTSVQINVAVSVGGSGGAAGSGGAVNATNTGSIGTFGAQSDGIFAQSVGGGGGSGGAASSTGSASDDTPVQSGVAVGGRGGAAGSGGTVTVVNGSGGNILTQGVAAFGIAAQSVGGGGGEGSIAGVVSGSLKSLSIGVGGNGGGAGDGGAVSVTTGDGTAGSSITTTGKNGIGIFAQSVGGGGGLVRTMTTDQTFDPAQLINNPQGRVADVQGFSLTFGGQNGSSGKGGPVQVTTNGPITTSGLDAHGILAQSIGGGGGAVVGGQLVLPPSGTAGAGGGAGGDGGPVTIQLNGPTNIATTGTGAYGVLAQSIGGGGGLSGDPSGILVYNIATNLAVKANSGNGGAVSITANGATVHTSGQNAPAIFAQSIGGGGGLVNYSLAGGAAQVQALGTAGGTGTGGGVTIGLTSSSIAASGLGSSGIVAQSDGTASSAIKISVDAHSQVLGGASNGINSPTADTAGIRLFGGTGNQITNAGYIGAASGVAILATGPASNTTITNTGTIAGNILVGGDPPVVNNQVGGVISATTIDLGSAGLLQNSGMLHVGGSGTTGTTILTGNLQQTPTGTLVVRLAPASNTADVLQVNGTATLDGRIVPIISDPSQFRSGARQVAIIAASGGLSLVGTANITGSTPIVRYGLAAPDTNTLDLSYNVDFAATDALRAAGLASRNRAEVGRALNVALSGPAGDLALHGGRLATLTTPEQVAQSLDVLSGEGIADIQQTVFTAQQAYVTTVQRHVTTGIAESGPASYTVAALGPVPSAAVNDNGVRVWLGGFGGNDMLSSTEGLGSLHSQIAGGLIGIDKWFDPDTVAGVSIGGGAVDYSVPSRGVTGHSTTVNVAAYGLERFGRAYVSGVLSYGNFATDAQRNALGGATDLIASAHASATNNVLGGRAELGWRQPLGGITLTPFAALEVDQLWQAPLTDTAVGGAGADALALHFSGVQQTSVPMTLGVRAGTSFAFGGDHVLSLSTELGWVHEFNPHRSVTAAFVAAPNVPFQSLGMSPSRDSALASVDARLPITRNVALLGSFGGRFSGVETAVGGFGGLQVTW